MHGRSRMTRGEGVLHRRDGIDHYVPAVAALGGDVWAAIQPTVVAPSPGYIHTPIKVRFGSYMPGIGLLGASWGGVLGGPAGRLVVHLLDTGVPR